MSHHVTPCHTMSHHVTPCHTMSHHVTPCHTMSHHAMHSYPFFLLLRRPDRGQHIARQDRDPNPCLQRLRTHVVRDARRASLRLWVRIGDVGGTRCVPSSTNNIMKRRITLTVACIRTCLFIIFDVDIQGRIKTHFDVSMLLSYFQVQLPGAARSRHHGLRLCAAVGAGVEVRNLISYL
jgi:hypothetical protein